MKYSRHEEELMDHPRSVTSEHMLGSTMSVHSRLTMGSRRTVLTEAEEAELLSRATSQAMIAARSIILSGGSHATALSTAKAAAQSILVPNTSEVDGPALGKVFLSRRKAKRQAEVVASMAMLSVKQQTMQHVPVSAQQSQQLEAASFMQGFDASNHPTYGGTPNGTTLVPTNTGNTYRNGGGGGGGMTNASLRGTGTYDQSFDQNYSYDRSFVQAPSRSYDRSYEDGMTRRSRNMLQPQLSARLFRNQPQQQQASQSTVRQDAIKFTASPATSPKLPGLLPKSRLKNSPKTRDLAKSVPEEDPIYSAGVTAANGRVKEKYATFSGGDSSSDDSHSDESGTFGSGTFGSETLEHTTIAPTSDLALDKDGAFLQSSVDPFFATLASVFFCGSSSTPPTSAEKPVEASSKNRDLNQPVESRHDEDDQESSSESEDERSRRRDTSGRERPPRSSRVPPRPMGSHSTADSSQLLKELNLSSDDEDAPPANKQDQPMGFLNTGSSIRESMEQVVLRALSGTLQSPVESPKSAPPPIKRQPTPPRAPEPQMTITVADKLKETDCMSSTSSLSTSNNRNRISIMAQRVKFRRWMRRRRVQGGADDE